MLERVDERVVGGDSLALRICSLRALRAYEGDTEAGTEETRRDDTKREPAEESVAGVKNEETWGVERRLGELGGRLGERTRVEARVRCGEPLEMW